ncbi:MAG: WbqC family protein [Gammaproteobacteria bacterium]|nr:WbqC family protein [Gammaproteobacteria bacterium]
MKTVVVLQSNYLPWKGYFDLIHDADLFVFYDDVQFTKNDWRNRNKIKTSKGLEWITVPVGTGTGLRIHEVEIKSAAWQKKHWKTIRQNYAKSPYFNDYREFFEDFYLGHQWTTLSDMNQHLIRTIATKFLGISAEFSDSRIYNAPGQKLERLLYILNKTNANRYVTGPAAKDYTNHSQFSFEGIELVWKDYSGYPEYSQRYSTFEHGVSILDLLFNVGPDAPWYIWGWRKGNSG